MSRPALSDLAGGEIPVTVVEPASGWRLPDFRELWRYRDLLFFLALRDLKVRYKQTALGATWAVLQPVFTMLVFSVFFGGLAKVPSDGLPYPVFAFAALLPWQMFSYALNQSGNSLVANERLLTKVYFPRLLIPLSSVLSGLVDFAIAFVVLLGLAFWYRIPPTAALLVLPPLVLFVVITAFAVGLWLSALNVQYRDVRHTLPFLTQLWLFVTPVAYPSSLVPARYRLVYGLNPMAGVVDGFRWAILKGAPAPGPMLLVSVGTVVILLVGGLIYFRRMERNFADVV
ncbi:MAG: ABC transporter permease [Acidobacteriia bacterium]|nr:ABC transporter permease [Terriglobia bacterium]